MTRLPSLGYEEVIKALQRDGWVITRQRKRYSEEFESLL